MNREWQPGDVAMVDGRVAFAWIEDGDGDRVSFLYVDGDGFPCIVWANGVLDARPLVVIDLSETPAPSDPAGRTEAHHLIDMLRETAENFFVPDAAALARKVADQIERQVGPRKPPKPEEPTGLGAVVEDAEGKRYVRHPATGNESNAWCDEIGCGRPWARVDAVRVLSEGVTA